MYSIVVNDDNVVYGVNTYLADSIEEIQQARLKCAPGSKAYIITNGQLQTYVLSPSREWKQFIAISAGTGGGSEIDEQQIQQIVNDAITPELVQLQSNAINQNITLFNNTDYYIEGAINSLTIESFTMSDKSSVEQWSITFTTDNNITPNIVFGNDLQIVWSVAKPVFEPNKTYWLSFRKLYDKYLGVWSVLFNEGGVS